MAREPLLSRRSSIRLSNNYIHMVAPVWTFNILCLESQYTFLGKEIDYHLFDLTTLADESHNLDGGHRISSNPFLSTR